MPMIDIHATAGTFADTHQLATDAAATVMRIDQVPDIPMVRQNPGALVTAGALDVGPTARNSAPVSQ